ncbi:MAG TPA: iron chelate uptake ABC transporter family permease subunit [Candidatus Limnocylindria bacterium]|nr:iron chelate uptake ABC transporter family permease subunit [Candidatus Limnocylindria bacterium]
MRATVTARPLVTGPTPGRAAVVLAGGGLMVLAAGALALALGTVGIGPLDALGIVGRRIGLPVDGAWAPSTETIVWEIRLPRVLTGMVVGAGLGASGAVFQALFRNPMADPYIIGTASGASLGAVGALVLPTLAPALAAAGGGPLGTGLVQASAFAGALATVGLVYALARSGSGVPVVTLLLTGYAVSAVLAAIVALLIFLSGRALAAVVAWIMGSLAGASWGELGLAGALVTAAVVLLLLRWRRLNLLLLGESQAAHLGLGVEREKLVLTMLAALATSAAVAVAGTIGFVGLVAPHLVRLAVGPDHRLLLPASALLGAALLTLADAGARLAGGIPVGVVTALIGAPFFLWLLRRSSAVRPRAEP